MTTEQQRYMTPDELDQFIEVITNPLYKQGHRDGHNRGLRERIEQIQGPRVTATVNGWKGQHEAVLEWRLHDTCNGPGWCYIDDTGSCVADRDIVTMHPLIGGDR